MKFHSFSGGISRKSQQGWIMLEVTLCFALLAFVLHLVQVQSQTQWQSIQLAENQRKLEENQQKQALMEMLVVERNWSADDDSQDSDSYPECQECTGSQLERWFYASQHDLSETYLSETGLEGEE
ncbi:hypothetical protein ACMUMQ_01455 [Marinomonas sp. 2405UD66-6]|uniref:hypothetical protein n=1 Tax=Marinomonas sp. 2405UD66-6 TaxID=3391834 RepID=UPI0039C8DC63